MVARRGFISQCISYFNRSLTSFSISLLSYFLHSLYISALFPPISANNHPPPHTRTHTHTHILHHFSPISRQSAVPNGEGIGHRSNTLGQPDVYILIATWQRIKAETVTIDERNQFVHCDAPGERQRHIEDDGRMVIIPVWSPVYTLVDDVWQPRYGSS